MKRNDFILMMLCAPTAMFSQIGFAETNVNIVIAQMQSIEISHLSVSIDMNQALHYLSGSSSGLLQDHIRITSSAGYQVTVRSDSEFFLYNGSSSTLPVNSIALGLYSGTDLSGPVTSPSEPVLLPIAAIPAQPLTVISCSSPGGSRGYNAEYRISSQNAPVYINRLPGIYSTTIVYTLLPQ